MLRLWVVACRIVGTVVTVGVLVTAFTPVPNLVARTLAVPADIGPADAIVVLGSSVNRDGSLTDASQRRALAGIDLYRAGRAPRLVMLGMYDEAAGRARLAELYGVPRAAILTENAEPTTRHEAARIHVVLGERLGARTILLVTDAFHMRRARDLFQRQGFVVRPAPTSTGILLTAKPEERVRLARIVGQEFAAFVYHKAFGYL